MYDPEIGMHERRCSLELIEWDTLRLAIRSNSVDRENLDWMTNSCFWQTFVACQIAEGDVIFDLGSHIGSFGLRAASYRRCVVWAAEPDHDSATLHRINSAINQLDATQTISEVAVGGRDGVVRLYEATTNWAHTITGVGSVDNILTGNSTSVQCLSLNSCLARSRAPKVTFMKLNIEGAEFNFIREASVPDLRRIGVIVGELHFDLAPSEKESEIVDKLTLAGCTSKVLPSNESRSFLIARCV